MKQEFKVANHPYIIVLILALGIQLLGYTLYINANGSAIGKTLWLNLHLPDQIAYGIDYYLAILFFPLLIFGFIRNSPWPFYLCFLWLGTLSVLTWYQGGSFSAPYSVFAHNNRYLLPACLAIWIHSKSPNKKTYDDMSIIFTISIAVVFITHGIEALNKNPTFIDYTLRFFRNYTPLWIEEKHAKFFLIAVGIQDIFLALAILLKPNKWVFAYMAFWGAWTAVLRTFYSPDYGLSSTLIRAANGAIPLVLCLQHFNWKDFPTPPKKTPLWYLIGRIKGFSQKIKAEK